MIFNFGSINVDHVYRLANMPKPGETLMAQSYERFLGGKGVNQSVAIAKSGGAVRHIGAVGPDGDWSLTEIERFGVATDFVTKSSEPTGNAIIYVDDAGENQIVILGGANQQISEADGKEALKDAGREDWVLFQNEINLDNALVSIAKARNCKIAYSAAPFDAQKVSALLADLTLLAVNETEAADVEKLLGKPPSQWNVPMVLITLGSKGAMLLIGGQTIEQSAYSVEPIDTTGAGDTFLGAFLARLDQGDQPEEALKFASAASALQVTRMGAAAAIPSYHSTTQFLKDQST